MSFEPPDGILDIGNATLRVGKLEVAETSGLNQGLQNIIKNDLLITENTTYAINHKWGLKLPTTWVADFDVKGHSGKYIDFNFYNENSDSNALGYNLTFMDTTMTLRYDGGSPLGGGAVTIPTIVGAYRKVNIFFERNVIAVSIDGTRYIYDKRPSVLSRVISTTGSAFVNVFIESDHSNNSGFKNLRIVNSRFVSDQTSNIAFIGGNLGVGVNSPTESLDVLGSIKSGANVYAGGEIELYSNLNIQQVSNTGTIQNNSNVVTEFSRSKKLIKYPRVLLTSAALNSAYENGYKVTFSLEHTSMRAYYPFSAEDNGGWKSHYSGMSGTAQYNGTGGLYSATTRLAPETELGEWLGLELPEAIKLQKVRMASQNFAPNVDTVDNFIIYAKKQSGDTWTHLGTFVDMAASMDSPDGVMVNVDPQKKVEYYKFFAIVVTKRYTAHSSSGVSIRVLEYLGIPEYDPDAHGTEVVIKSLPNVPNTDWLEVYYDAKNYSGSGDVQDETANNRDGTIDGVAYDSVSKSFTFDGVNDKIDHGPMSFTPSDATSGYTASLWFKVPKIEYVGSSYATGNTNKRGGKIRGNLTSKGLTGNQGFSFALNNAVVKDMTLQAGRVIAGAGSPSPPGFPVSRNPIGNTTSLSPSGQRYAFNDWGQDVWDGWGDWYIYNPATVAASYIQFSQAFLNGPDGTVYTDPQTHHGIAFTIKHGYVAQGIFKIDIECSDPTFRFAIGANGNMGSDSTTFNEDRQYTASWGTLNYNFNGDDNSLPTTNATDPVFSYFVPKDPVFNAGITLSGNNFTSNWTTVCHGDNMAHYSSPLTLGATLYYVKAANNTFPQDGANVSMKTWVANDIEEGLGTRELFHFGHGSSDGNDSESFGMNIANGNVGIWTWGADKSKQTSSNLYTVDEWVHATGTIYNDPVTGHSLTKIFVNGELRPESVQKGILPNLAIPTNPYLTLGTSFIGERTSYDDNYFKGSIANFRLFNRVMTSDEIYQLYAYQKEYFGLGNLGMTIKSGRLGIGIPEPSVALDVKGDIKCDIIMPRVFAFSAYAVGGGDSNTTGIFPATHTYYNFGDCYDTDTYRFNAPTNGVYHFEWNSFTNTAASSTSRIFLKKNGNHEVQKGNSIYQHGNGLSVDVYLDSGDYVTIEGGSSYPLYYYAAAGHNHYSGHLVYATG